MLDLPDKKEFSRLYLKRVPVWSLAERYFVSEGTIFRWAKEFGISNKGDFLDKRKLKKLFDSGLSVSKISQRLCCSKPTVRKYLKKYGITKTTAKPKIQIDIEEMYRLRVACKWTYKELGELYQVSFMFIKYRCVEFNFPVVRVGRQIN